MGLYWNNKWYLSKRICRPERRRANRKLSLNIAAGVLLLWACGGGGKEAEEIIASVKELHAPDKRTVIFDVSPRREGGALLIAGETSSPKAKKELFRKLDSAGLETIDSLQVLPAENVGAGVFGVARLSVCNLRVEPSHSAEMATQVLLGTPLRILKDRGSWLQVQTPEHYIAWTQESGLVRMDSAGFRSWQSQQKLIFTADFGQATAGPGSGSVVSDLVIGDILLANGEVDGFYQCAFPDGRQAYIKKEEAEPFQTWVAERQPSGTNVLAAARRMMGAPYLWGGTSSKGVDCSGFTKTAFFMNGIILPRDASQQVLAGQAITISAGDSVDISTALEQLRKGDLLFFTNDPARRNQPDARITHVGIYIENGEFIHSSGFVHRSSLLDTSAIYSEWHARTLTRARRILGTEGLKAADAHINTHPWYHRPAAL